LEAKRLDKANAARVAVRLGLSALAAAVSIGIGSAAENKRLDYGRDVRPILSENCFHCHGQDGKKRMAGLRLDTFEGAVTQRGDHAALVPGKPETSGIYQRITSEKKAMRMPPVSSNRSLTAEQIAILKRWIAEGGEYSKHWAFIPPERGAVPTEVDKQWVKQPIDAFVSSRLKAENLQPTKEASPGTWLRRVSLDLVGLPPSPAEIDAFTKEAKERGEAAYTATVDRLLASPRYGERMAMEWLDVARYADTHGFNNDSSRSMWRWRDWVIDSFNANKPYNQFLTEQLAGDLLPKPTLDQRIATGFGRNHVINSEGGIIEEEYRIEYVEDRVRTLGMSWLGLTLECARCHDHKFDPISQKDHFRFFAFFNNVPELGEDGRVTNAVPLIPAPTREQQARMHDLEATIAAHLAKLERRQASWRWRTSDAAKVTTMASAISAPTGATLHLGCESAEELGKTPEAGFSLGTGVAGKACVFTEPSAKLSTPKPGVTMAKRAPFTLSLWANPATTVDAPLLSTADYATSTAGTMFGRGVDLRLANGELEFRYIDRFPAYAIRVVSQGAKLQPGQWRHVTLIYEGAENKPDLMRADASWVRMYVDGHELSTSVITEGIALPGVNSDKPKPETLRIGWDTRPKSPVFTGSLDEIQFWPQALTHAQILASFESNALPYAASRQAGKQATAVETNWVRQAMLRTADPQFAKAEKALHASRAERVALERAAPTTMVMEELETPRETHILLRGAYNAPGEKVEPGVPEDLLGAWPADAPRNRLGLAQWLTKPDHPLTSRVVVNRFWQQLFGTGLVKSSDNFGLQGESPSHPELLDWMAREFIDSGWNVKALMKQIVLSAVYRQESAALPELFARDPENRLLARGPRFRLPAELIRDQALLVSGLLKQRIGGPSVFPYQPKDLYKGIVVAADYPGTKYIESTGDDLYRRSLYTFWKRTVPHPTMTVFDAPDREFCIVKRSNTNTPLQALTLLNDPIFVEAARKLAERSYREGGNDNGSRLERVFRLSTGRAPLPAEKQVLQTTFDRMLAAYREDEAAAKALLAVGASPCDASIPVSELAAYTAVANMVLNMDEVITKG
jgi:hypothetical protein